MEAQIQASGGDEVAEFAELWDRLGGDPALRTVDRLPGEWELGGPLDMLPVAREPGSAGVTLARALPVGLKTRRSDVTVTVTFPSGKTMLDAQRLNDAAVIPLPQEVLRDRDEW